MIDLIDVPIFFILSGYLSRKQFLKLYAYKKIKQLLIPFLWFTSLKLVCNLLLGSFSHSQNVMEEIGVAFINGDYYWFSYCLIIMMIIIPIFWNMKKERVFCIWGIVIVLYLIASFSVLFALGGGPFQIINVLRYMPWFLGGYTLKIFGFPKESKLAHFTILCISVICCFGGIVLCWKGLMNYHINELLLSSSVFYILFSIFMKQERKIGVLILISKYSYQIFFLDSFIKIVLFIVVEKFTTISAIMIVPIVGLNIFISVVICMIISKTKYLKILFGL